MRAIVPPERGQDVVRMVLAVARQAAQKGKTLEFLKENLIILSGHAPNSVTEIHHQNSITGKQSIM